MILTHLHHKEQENWRSRLNFQKDLSRTIKPSKILLQGKIIRQEESKTRNSSSSSLLIWKIIRKERKVLMVMAEWWDKGRINLDSRDQICCLECRKWIYQIVEIY
jgi:hypothetical protein